jgi:general secretion pathway protein K
MTRGSMRGLALVAVLWIVAALSILVVGMSQTVRGDVRIATAQRQSLLASGTGDAALQLTLQALAIQRPRTTRLVKTSVAYQGAQVEVTVLPASGFIDLNSTTVPLLSALLTVAGGLPPGPAQQLAQTIIDTRSGKRADNTAGRPTPFEAIEDLLSVPGVDYALYARISRLVTVDGLASGRVDPLAASLDVLMVLADGNAASAARIATARDAGQAGIDTATTLNSAYLATGMPERFRLEARVALADGRQAVTARTVDLADGSADGLPWRTLQTQRWIETPSTPTN